MPSTSPPCAARDPAVRPLAGGTGARSELGRGGTRRRPAAGRARCGRHQGRAARRRSVSTPARLPRLESQPEVGGARPQGGRGPGGVPAALRDADVLVETFSPGTMDRLGLSYADIAARSPLGLLLGAGLSARTPIRRSTRLGRHRPGPLGHAERAARLATRAHVPPLSRPEHGGVLPPGGRRALGSDPTRGDRARAARPDLPLPRSARLHHADLAGARAGTRRLSLDDGEDLSTRHPSDVPLRVRRRRVDPRRHDEWPHATRTPEEILGLDLVDPRALYADPEFRGRTRPGCVPPMRNGAVTNSSRSSTRPDSALRR